jgi:hypothetical protein
MDFPLSGLGRFRNLILFASGITVAILTGLWLLGRDDPIVNGRRLSVAVMDLLYPGSATYDASSNAVAQAGVGAAPLLQELMNRPEGTFEKMKMKLGLPVPAYDSMFGRQLAACRAARIVETNAVSLKDDLTRLTESPIGSIRFSALEALFTMTTLAEIYPIVTNAIVSEKFMDCQMAAIRFAVAGGGDADAMLGLIIEHFVQPQKGLVASRKIRTVLLRLKSDPNAVIARAATNALVEIGKREVQATDPVRDAR